MERPERGSNGIVHFLLLPLLATGLFAVADEIARRAGLVSTDALVGVLMYASLSAWILYRAPRPPYGIHVAALSGAPRRRGDWMLLVIDVPLIFASVGALYLVVLALSVVAPRMVAEWLAAPDSVSDVVTLRLLPVDLLETAIGAIAEEWLFRGVLLHIWASRFGMRFGVLATSMVFAVLHADVIGSLIFGIAMCALYVRSGTLLVPIVAHMVFNAIISAVAVVQGPEQPMTLREFREDWWQAVLALAGSVAVIVVALRRIVPGAWTLPGTKEQAPSV